MEDHAPPTVSVVIATFNWSSVLQFAITSVLAQTFDDFELLVVGDCCTDDSEAVVRSFADPRIRWFNLAENAGSQFGPNNEGLAHARGQYVAYLGHDDLWHRDHLAVLVRTIEAHNADLVFAITLEVGPPSMPTRGLLGLAPKGEYEWSMWAPPSSWLHRRDLIDKVGPWRDPTTIVMPTDVEFLNRVLDHGCLILPADELTVFKFPSVARTNSYVERRCDEQAVWWTRLGREPELRYRELIEALKTLARQHPDIVARFSLPGRVTPGSITAAYRARRGLKPRPGRATADAPPLFRDRSLLKYLSAASDIVSANDTEALHRGDALPVDGLFLGLNWYSLEVDAEGTRWRWIDTDAQIVVTRPSGRCRRLAIDLIPGPGIGGKPCGLMLRDAAGMIVEEVQVDAAGVVAFDLPEGLLRGEGAIFSLDTEDGGRTIRGDPRILNFRIFGLSWVDERLSS